MQQLEKNLQRLEMIKTRPRSIESKEAYHKALITFRIVFSDKFCLLEDSLYYRAENFYNLRKEKKHLTLIK